MNMRGTEMICDGCGAKGVLEDADEKGNQLCATCLAKHLSKPKKKKVKKKG